MNEQEIEKVLDEIFSLYKKYGANNYIGEQISQIEHMCQAADLAEQQGYDAEVILAAFFHDIGHIIEHVTDSNTMGEYGIMEHEKLGANFLRERGFSERIAKLVQSHVEAKRYLTFAEPGYYEQLSEASKQTLAYQGGRMTAEEAAIFESDELYLLKVQLRKWDEQAKVENVPLSDIEKYRLLAKSVLLRAS